MKFTFENIRYTLNHDGRHLFSPLSFGPILQRMALPFVRADGAGELDEMRTALYLGLQGLIGAFDTLFYHEWKARLPARGRRAAPELALHAARDFLYGVLFCTLPWLAWKGIWTIVLLGVIVAEIILTLWDFVVEIAVRRDLGDVYAGERVTHAIMRIMYGAMLASLAPTLNSSWGSPGGLAIEPATAPEWMRIFVSAMGAGVIGSGLRDLYGLGPPFDNAVCHLSMHCYRVMPIEFETRISGKY